MFAEMSSDVGSQKSNRVLVVGADHAVGSSITAGLTAQGWRSGTLAAGAAKTQAAGAADVGSVLSGLGGLDALVIAVWSEALTVPKPVEELTDTDIAEGWEGAMQTMIWTLQAAFPSLVASKGSAVVVLPTTAMSGGRNYSLAAATFEAQRILMKATARQWGPNGVRINAVAISPESVLDDPEQADVHYLAPAALGDDRSIDMRADDLTRVVDFLLSERSSGLTGQTLGVDGGRWLAP